MCPRSDETVYRTCSVRFIQNTRTTIITLHMYSSLINSIHFETTVSARLPVPYITRGFRTDVRYYYSVVDRRNRRWTRPNVITRKFFFWFFVLLRFTSRCPTNRNTTRNLRANSIAVTCPPTFLIYMYILNDATVWTIKP